jgi:hypothetical protein
LAFLKSRTTLFIGAAMATEQKSEPKVELRYNLAYWHNPTPWSPLDGRWLSRGKARPRDVIMKEAVDALLAGRSVKILTMMYVEGVPLTRDNYDQRVVEVIIRPHGAF